MIVDVIKSVKHSDLFSELRKTDLFSHDHPQDKCHLTEEFVLSLQKRLREFELENNVLAKDKETMTLIIRDLQISQKKAKLEVMSLKQKLKDIRFDNDNQAMKKSISIDNPQDFEVQTESLKHCLTVTTQIDHKSSFSSFNSIGVPKFEDKEESTDKASMQFDLTDRARDQAFDLTDQADRIAKLEIQLKEACDQNDRALVQIESLSKEKEALLQEVDEIKLHISSSVFTLGSSQLLYSPESNKNDNIRTNTQNDSPLKQNLIILLQEQLGEACNQLEKAKAIAEEIHIKYISLNEDFSILKRSIYNYSENENTLMGQLSQGQRRCSNLEIENDSLINENEQLRHLLNKLQSEHIENSPLKTKKMEIELESAQKKSIFLEKRLNEAEIELQAVLFENSKLEYARKEMCSEVQRYSSLDLEINQELEEKTFRLSMCMVQLAMVKSELARLQTERLSSQ
jgi:hypothetical protein